MSNKKFYWFKLKTGYFEKTLQRYIRKMPGGSDLLIAYLKLQLRSLETEGYLKYQGVFPSITKELSLDIDEPEENIMLLLKILEQFKAIDVYEDKSIYFNELQDCIGKEGSSAERMRKFREKQKQIVELISEGNTPLSLCDNDVTTGDNNVTPEKEKEKEKEDLIGLDNINLYLNNIELLQNETDEYNKTFKLKEVYIENTTYIKQDLLNKYKLYQLAIKRFVDNKQTAILNKLNLTLLEKVFVQVSKAKNIDSIVEYYISSVINELTKR